MSRKRIRGFTLIELLVVVAIIALLISILLPALNRAKEQGRIVVCAANLRTIAQGVNVYLNDGNDDIVFAWPFDYHLDGVNVSFNLITEFIWGGGVPDKQPADWLATGLAPPSPIGPSDIYKIRPKDRPLNKYMSSSVSWDDPLRVFPRSDRHTRKMDLPDFFKCPSDKTVAVPLAGAPNTEVEGSTPFTTWSFWGTSYASNWYWPYYYQRARPGNAAPYNADFARIIAGDATEGLRGLSREIMKGRSGRFASEFIIMYENRLNYALEGAYPRGFSNPLAKQLVGWHRQLNYHQAAFLDGSVRYQRMDTRYVDGPGWTIWPPRPWTDFWVTYNNN